MRLTEMLHVSRSGYYAWTGRVNRVSKSRQRREKLLKKIHDAHLQSRRLYGSPRVHRKLLAQGEKVCENTVARLMKQQQLRSRIKKKFRIKTTDSKHRHQIAANLLDRKFQQETPDKVWASDITYVPTDQGWLYLAAVIDLCSRRIVGWAMADHLQSRLAIEAVEMAISRRGPQAGLVHHSDRGVQYACGDYRDRLEQNRMTCSMSRKGNCYDNAVMESFFATLKNELIYQEHYADHQQAKASIFEYIEVFYNRQRAHSSLGYLSPEQFEASRK